MTHALAASAALGVLVFSRGFANFWQQFVHGNAQVMTPQTVMQNLLASTALFGSLLLVLWASTFFFGSGGGCRPMNGAAQTEPPGEGSGEGTGGVTGEGASEGAGGGSGEGTGGVTGEGSGGGTGGGAAFSRVAAVKAAAVAAPFLTAAALGLNWLGANAIEWIARVKPSDQELVKCFSEGAYPIGVRAMMICAVLLQAPLLEEPIFRGIMFRGFARSMPVWAAAALSGFAFALIHVNASSFVALWFLGAAFAVLYHRTGSMLAPMTAHFLFNAANLAMLFL